MLKEDFQIVLDTFRKIIHAIRVSSIAAEKTMGLSTAQIFLLQQLSTKDQMTLKELAAASFTQESAVSSVVAKLINRRLIEQVHSTDYDRPLTLKITDQGTYLLEKCPNSIQSRLLTGFSQMSETEQKTLAKSLQILLEKSGMNHNSAPMLLEELVELEEEL